MTEEELRTQREAMYADFERRWRPLRSKEIWIDKHPAILMTCAVICGMTLMAAGISIGAGGFRAHAESIMTPIDANGRLVDSGPVSPGLTTEERLERLERQSTAHCADTSYHLEARSSGLVCVRPAR